jgi:hypothetical protein
VAGVEEVVAPFVPQVVEHEHGGSDTQGQPGDIDDRKELVFEEVANGHQEVILDHGHWVGYQ